VAVTGFDQLTEATDSFFQRHWVPSALGPTPPSWERWETFLSGSVPNHDKAGCYALFAGHELIYVGLGASKGGGIYVEYGLSRRLTAHVICADRERGPQWSKLEPGWSSVTGVYTLGFAADLSYLAASLETYLIRALQPPRNGRV
jgi:hypothetical protein